MYYPYLRGRHNELACIRELLEEGRLGDFVVPIIEPVRFSKVLFDTLQAFNEAGHDIILVQNPKVGSFYSEYETAVAQAENEEDDKKRKNNRDKIQRYMQIFSDERITKAYINDGKVYQSVLAGKLDADNVFIINLDKDGYDFYLNGMGGVSVGMTFIPQNEDFRDIVSGNVVVLEDGFIKEKRNKDYIEKEDQMFSMNHLTYRKRGYSGFSDYSIVGKDYEEGGFAPLAVAIHIVYFNNRNHLRIHHFVSESNDSFVDTAHKFGEAMVQLKEWIDYRWEEPTLGVMRLMDYYDSGKFPGLGIVKRCSIMHHLELMSRYLEENE